MDQDALLFISDEGERIRIPRADVRRARRVLGSPVIELAYRREDRPRVALLFFAEPPAMGGRAGRRRSGPAGGTRRRRRRIGAAMDLRRANRRVKTVVREWAEAMGA